MFRQQRQEDAARYAFRLSLERRCYGATLAFSSADSIALLPLEASRYHYFLLRYAR